MQTSRFANLGLFLKKTGLDPFVMLLIAMVILARFFPGPGIGSEFWQLPAIAGYGVSLIFFFYGLKLSPEKLKAGLLNWRLHLVVQLSTFALFPLLLLSIRSFFSGADQELTWLSIYFLATLPSTVSLSVVMVSIAEGNVPSAIFNASISSLMGVFITPVLMAAVMDTSGESVAMGSVFLKLFSQVVVPVLLGITLHKRYGSFAEKHKNRLRAMDQSVILLIVYTAYCESFTKGVFNGFSLLTLVLLGVGMILLFFIIFGAITLLCKLLRFSRRDKVTALFCGSKKSMIHGSVMSKVLFAHTPDLIGMMLLPLMLYHAMQAILGTAIARRMGRQQAPEAFSGERSTAG